jgi:hypothetical protein
MEHNILEFLIKIGINLITLYAVVGLLHYRLYKKSEFIFTYTIFNVIIFLLSFVLRNNTMSIGAAFGLFAVFSMIRYRTEDISARDMTYLFIVIAVGMLNAVHTLAGATPGSIASNSLLELVIYNAILVGISFALESSIIMKRELMQSVQYENITNIKPVNREALLADLSERTGLKVHRVEIGKIDFIRDSANVKIYYYL